MQLIPYSVVTMFSELVMLPFSSGGVGKPYGMYFVCGTEARLKDGGPAFGKL